MSTPIFVTVVLLIVIGMTIFFYLCPSIDDKQNIPGVGVDTVSTKKIHQDRGYAPTFQGKIQKFVDDKRVIDNQITKISDQSKRLRIVEVELKNKLIKQKTEAELKRSLDSQFRLDNELSIEEVSQLDNSERDRKLQIDETAKVLEQITSTVKIIDSKLIEVKLAKNKEYEDKSQIISDEIDEKKEQAYLKIQKAKMLVEQAKKDKEDRAAAFRARMAKYKEVKVVIEPTVEEKYARAIEIALKNKAVRLKAEAEMKQLLDAQRKLQEDLSENERIALDDADEGRQAVIDENDRLMEEANLEVKNAEALRVVAQAKIDDEYNASVSEAAELRKDEEKRRADIDAKAEEKLEEFQLELDQAEKDQVEWDQALADQVEESAELESSVLDVDEEAQAKYDADLARDELGDGAYNEDGEWVSNADVILAEAEWLIGQANDLALANFNMETGEASEGVSVAAAAENERFALEALSRQQAADLNMGRAELRAFNMLGYAQKKREIEYDIDKKTSFTTPKLPILPYINPVNGLDTESAEIAEIRGPAAAGRWTISQNVERLAPSVEEKLQNDIHALFPGKSRVRGWLWFTEADVTAGTAKEYESKDEAIFANRDPSNDPKLVEHDGLWWTEEWADTRHKGFRSENEAIVGTRDSSNDRNIVGRRNAMSITAGVPVALGVQTWWTEEGDNAGYELSADAGRPSGGYAQAGQELAPPEMIEIRGFDRWGKLVTTQHEQPRNRGTWSSERVFAWGYRGYATKQAAIMAIRDPLKDPKLVNRDGLWWTGGYVSKQAAIMALRDPSRDPSLRRVWKIYARDYTNAVSDHNREKFKALMVKLKALQAQRKFQGDGLDNGPEENPTGTIQDKDGNVKKFDHATRTWGIYEPPLWPVSLGFDDFGFIRSDRSSQPLIDKCKSTCDKFTNCGGFELDNPAGLVVARSDMKFCRLVNKDVLDLTPRSLSDDGDVLEQSGDKRGLGWPLSDMHYKVQLTELEERRIQDRRSRRARIIELLPEYAKIPDPDLNTGEDKAVSRLFLRREKQFTKLLSDQELLKHCRSAGEVDYVDDLDAEPFLVGGGVRMTTGPNKGELTKGIKMYPKKAVPKRGSDVAMAGIAPLTPKDCNDFFENPSTRGPAGKYQVREVDLERALEAAGGKKPTKGNFTDRLMSEIAQQTGHLVTVNTSEVSGVSETLAIACGKSKAHRGLTEETKNYGTVASIWGRYTDWTKTRLKESPCLPPGNKDFTAGNTDMLNELNPTLTGKVWYEVLKVGDYVNVSKPFSRTADDTSIKYNRIRNRSVPASASKLMVDIDVNTGLHTTDSNMSRVTGGKEKCMTACNKFPVCKSFVIGNNSVTALTCHLKSEQAGGMTVPSTTHNMWFKERGGFQRVSTREEIEKAESLSVENAKIATANITAKTKARAEILARSWAKIAGVREEGAAAMREYELRTYGRLLSKKQRDEYSAKATEAFRICSKLHRTTNKECTELSRAVKIAAARGESSATLQQIEKEVKAQADAKGETIEEQKRDLSVRYTAIQMCSPKKMVSCKHSPGVKTLTCDEFISCYERNNQTPCEDGFFQDHEFTADGKRKWTSCRNEIMAVKKAALDKKMKAAEVERLAKLEYENPSTNVSKNGRCGRIFGATICPGRGCCSGSGWCGGSVGQSSAYCSTASRTITGRRTYKGVFNGKYDGTS